MNDNMLREPQTTRPTAGEREDENEGERGGFGGAPYPRAVPAPRAPLHGMEALVFQGESDRGPSSMAARVERMLAQCRRQRGVMALVCVRVERIGAPGDDLPAALRRQVCQDVAHRMRSRVRGSDLLVHESDGEAGVLMAGAGADAAQRVEQRFAQALSGPYRVGDRLVDVAVRVGRAAYPDDGTLGSDLVLKARAAM
jgi:GGDEF domain-containing protein